MTIEVIVMGILVVGVFVEIGASIYNKIRLNKKINKFVNKRADESN